MPEFKIIAKDKDRTFYDYKISNDNFTAPVALVGLCPGYTQLKNILENKNIDIARKSASFKGCTKNIAKMLRKIRIDKKFKIEIPDTFDFNSSNYFFTTSLVKYPGLKEGSGRSDDFNPLDYEFAKKCIKDIFLNEILKGKSEVLIVFGKKAQNAIQEYKIEGNTVENIILDSGRLIIYLPHPSGSNNGGVARFLRS